MKTTLDLPDELVHQVKLRALMQGRTLRDLVADLLRQGLGMAQPLPADRLSASSRVQISEQGLPVIRCTPQAPAQHMRVEDLLQLEQQAQTQEDLVHVGHAV